MTARETYTIEVVSPTDRWRAFEFLLGSDVTQAPLLPSDQLVWAVGGGQVAGVAWAQRTSAATATVGMPRLCTTAPADLRTLLLTALIGRLHQKFSFEHLRALLARGDTEGRILLRSLGFKRVMEVDLLTASPGPCDPPLDVQLIPASADERIPLLDRLRKAFEEDEGAPNRIDWTDDEVFLNDDDD